MGAFSQGSPPVEDPVPEAEILWPRSGPEVLTLIPVALAWALQDHWDASRAGAPPPTRYHRSRRLKPRKARTQVLYRTSSQRAAQASGAWPPRQGHRPAVGGNTPRTATAAIVRGDSSGTGRVVVEVNRW